MIYLFVNIARSWFRQVFKPRLENGRVFKKLKKQTYESKWFLWDFTQAKVFIYQSIHLSELAGFLTQRTNVYTSGTFFAFQTSLCISCVQLQHFATFVFGFSVWFFKMEFNPLPVLLETGFTIIEISLFCGGEHSKRLPLTTWRCLLNRGTCLADVWKHFKYWLSFSNPSLHYWNYFPNDCQCI